jgi:hypothetical protein
VVGDFNESEQCLPVQAYLSPSEFPKVFGMSREEFCKMPGWKQKQKKDQKDLL